MGPTDTGRLRFRRLEASDYAELRTLHGDPLVMQWIGDPEQPGQVTAALQRWAAPTDERFGVWAAESLDGRLLGWFSLDLVEPGVGVLGYRLHRWAWGRGLATEGCRAVLHWAFAGAGLTRVIAQTYEHNEASRRVMAKLGMRLVRRFRLDVATLGDQPEWEGDELEYEVLAGEVRLDPGGPPPKPRVS